MTKDYILGCITGAVAGVSIFFFGFLVGGGWMQHDAITAGVMENHGKIYRVVPATVEEMGEK